MKTFLRILKRGAPFILIGSASLSQDFPWILTVGTPFFVVGGAILSNGGRHHEGLFQRFFWGGPMFLLEALLLE